MCWIAFCIKPLYKSGVFEYYYATTKINPLNFNR